MSQIPVIFNDTTPSAPAGKTNVKWQTDGSGNLSAYFTPAPANAGAPSGTLHGIGITNGGLTGTGSYFGCNPSSIGTEGGPFAVNPPLWYRLQTAGSTSAILDVANVITPATLQQIQFYVGISNGAFTVTTTGLRWWLCVTGLGAGSMNATNPAGTIIGFRFDASVDSHWMAYVSTSAGVFTAVSTGVVPTMIVTSPGSVTDQFKISADGSGGWNFYIDGTLVANIPTGSTGLPPGATLMNYMMETDSQATFSSQLYINSMQWWTAF